MKYWCQFVKFLITETYEELRKWSVIQHTDFWEMFWKYANIIHSQKYEEVGNFWNLYNILSWVVPILCCKKGNKKVYIGFRSIQFNGRHPWVVSGSSFKLCRKSLAFWWSWSCTLHSRYCTASFIYPVITFDVSSFKVFLTFL